MGGDQIRLSGMMSGGGSKKGTGAMRLREGRAFEQRDYDGPRISQAQMDSIRKKRDEALHKKGRYDRLKRET
eukprot:UN13803